MAYSPLYRISPFLLQAISVSTELYTRIRLQGLDTLSLGRFQQSALVRIAHASTSIEGNALTLAEVEAVAQDRTIDATFVATQEVRNYLNAVRWIWAQKNRSRILERDILSLHRRITADLLPVNKEGAYKTTPNRIIDARGRTEYVPPPPERVQKLTQELVEWLNSDECLALHPILVSAIVHHRLVSIHPFSDGNGRVLRALALWILISRGFDSQHILTLDDYFERNRQRYYSKLQQARDLDDDLTYWLDYVGEGIVQTLMALEERILSLRIVTISRPLKLSPRQEAILRYLTTVSAVSSSDLEHEFLLTRGRVNQLIKPLVEAGLLQREGKARATRYRLTNRDG